MISGWRDKALFTPGPLTTSRTVKQAMLRDVGSRDTEFIEVIREIRESLLRIAGVDPLRYEAVLMQGSGTFAVESVITTAVPREGERLLIVSNGAYGDRMRVIAERLRIPVTVVACPENEIPDPSRLDAILAENPDLSHVAVVHCETTTGILNPVDELGTVVKQHGRLLIVDAMSSFGGIPVDIETWGIDYLVSSANKCIEGVPGFGFVIARREPFMRTSGNARSLSLDLFDQWQGLESNGQFRFTPPTHTLLAFRQALEELEAEGGVQGRSARYQRNHRVLVEGMRGMGFRRYLPEERQGWIITSFLYPDHPRFDFERFYELLGSRGFAVYPGKLTNADCFRIGSIGRLFEADIKNLLAGIREVLEEMGVSVPLNRYGPM